MMYNFAGTVVGVRCEDGVALASDSRGTAYYHVLSKNVKKIFKLNEKIGAAVAGSSGDIQSFVRLLQTEADLYQLNQQRPISSKSIAQIASNLLHGRRYFPYILEGFVSGVDDDGPHLYFLDPVGGKLDEKQFAAGGTGATVAYGALERGYREGMEVGDGAKLAAESIKTAIERDAATGNRTVVAIIGKEGYRELSDEEVNKLMK
jgi:proteasome beta subunit